MYMATGDFFPRRPELKPMIYAYEEPGNPQLKGILKVGFTAAQSVRERVAQQYPIKRPGTLPYRIVLEESAMKSDGSSFTDHDVHALLEKRHFNHCGGEWYRCTVDDVRSAVVTLREGLDDTVARTETFQMRPEQQEAVNKAAAYLTSYSHETDKTPHFLWNAKMRFGKTFAAYQLALKMGWKRLLVLTFKPAVKNAWEEDLMMHVDFQGWQFISNGGKSYDDIDKNKPFVCFASFQDFLGKNKVGGIKLKNEWAHAINWDCIILDEYHYGAWRDHAKELYDAEDEHEQEFAAGKGLDYYDENVMPLTTNAYLYLSGTPFRAINSGEFIEEQIYNWTYSDEQRAKEEWQGEHNPYLSLPRMVLLTYQMPDSIRDVALKGEFNEFDLNEFFAATGMGSHAKFVHQDEVNKWLSLIRGAFMETTIDNLKLGARKPPMPYSDARLLAVLNHTLWFLPSVSACYAMNNLLHAKNNVFYHDYRVVVCAGAAAGIGADALPPVLQAMENPSPLETKTITLTCGKLTTGVSVKPWTGIFMLRNTQSPETYFQAAFRVQTPWVIKNPDGLNPNREEIMKKECYVFDFAPDRALRQIADYSCRLNIDENNPEKKIAEFIHFLPILCYDGSSMKAVDAAGILDFTVSGTTATLLARRWESALLVNVDNETLKKLINNKDAMAALSNIEGFRRLNEDIETIINKSNAINKTKKEANDHDMAKEERKELTQEEKEVKSLRRQIQEKLIKFATRIPIFMYLTDYRERSLKDVITQLEPGLFQKVTGLKIKDFELLVSLNVFNSALMNQAVFQFKRYEDASLEYAGINRHADDEQVGLYDTSVSKQEFVNSPLR
jgi:hypothetical protein